MHIGVVTLATPEMSAVGGLSEPDKRAYCNRHGYTFISHDHNPDAGRHPYWGKVQLLLRHLVDGFDWLFWTDADSLILNPDLRLEDLVAEDPRAELICTRDHHGINSGEFLISNRNGRAAAFLRAWYDQARFIAHARLQDQPAMTHVVDLGAVPMAVRYVPKRRLNADVRDYQPGDFLLHFYGQPGRVFLMRKYLRAAGGGEVGADGGSEGRPKAAAPAPLPRHENAALHLLREAHAHLSAGRAAEAEGRCREVLARDPDDVRATHLLGLTIIEAHARGKPNGGGTRMDEALDLLCRSLELAPGDPDFHNNLGTILHRHCGLLEDAAACFREALRLRPAFPAAVRNLAGVTAGQTQAGLLPGTAE